MKEKKGDGVSDRPNILLRLLIIICLGVSSYPLLAQESDDEDLLTLISLLETDISTKTDQKDQDQVPGLVTVLTGADLRARGVRNLSEAMNLVAGIQIPDAPRTPIVRGFGGISGFATGKSKYLVNGIAFDNIFASEEDTLLRLPMEMIERIEIIRGPGSAIYGENAFLGVINIVTSDKTQAYARFESFSTGLLGGGFSHTHANGGKSSLQISTFRSDGPRIIAGPDALFGIGQGAVSNAPGQTNEKEESDSLVYKYEQGAFKAMAQLVEVGSGDGFGIRSFLPSDSDRIAIERSELALSASYQQQLSENTTLDYLGVIKRNKRDFDEVEGLPAGAFGIYPTAQVATSSDGEDRATFAMDLTHRGFENQTILLGFEASHASTEDVALFTNIDLLNNIPGTPLPIPLPDLQRFELGYEDRDRDIVGVYIQDEIKVSDQMDVTAGVRFDDFSDVGSNASPRVAAVYRVDPKNTVKVQYAEAFRPPTMVELYSVANTFVGNPDIEPETIRTLEASYIYKSMDTVFRTTIYHSNAEDLIAIDPQLVYGNIDQVDSSGLELEIEQRIGDSFKFVGNLSFNDSEDQSTRQPLAGSVDTLATASIIYQPISRYSIVADVLHVGERNRGAGDMRDGLDGYNVVNLTLNLFDVGVAGLNLRAGVINLLDEDIVDPAAAGTYPEDFPGAGRSYFISLQKDF